MGQVVRFESIKSASRMNSAVVTFLDEVRKVEQVVECGIVVRDTFIPVFPLLSSAKKIMISNAPPFIKLGSVQSPVPVRTAGVPHKDGSVGMQITETKARRLSQKVSLHAAKRCYFSPEPDSDF